MKSHGSSEERATGGEAGKRRDLRTKGSIPALVTAIATGASQPEAARLSGMSVKTVQRRLREPAVVLAIHEARAELTRQALGRISSLRDLALDRVGAILADTESPALSLRAAELVLRFSAAGEAAWVQDKLVLLERQLSELEAGRERIGDA